LWPRLENSFLRTVAAVSMVFALVVTPWLAAGLPIITTVLVAIVVGWRSR
jgi:predicted anti-sigma-YlaC factor YlaD